MENMIVKTVFEICKSAETITFAYIVYPLTTHTTLHLCCLNFAQWGVFPSEDEAVTK